MQDLLNQVIEQAHVKCVRDPQTGLLDLSIQTFKFRVSGSGTLVPVKGLCISVRRPESRVLARTHPHTITASLLKTDLIWAYKTVLGVVFTISLFWIFSHLH